MTAPWWFLIGIAAGVAGTIVILLTRALRTAARELRTEITQVLDDPPELEDHIEDDIWDHDLRQLLHDPTD